jgi:Restriction alleviation protein Lar
MAEPLAPCPFCASLDLSVYGGHPGGRYWAVLCGQCWAMGPEGANADEAAERWNRGPHGRAPAPTVEEPFP